MRTNVKLFCCVVMSIFIAGVSAVSAQDVSGSIEGGSIKKGASARATIVLDIPSDLHVNSNTPSSEYLIATSVRATSDQAKIGEVTYPKGHDRKFGFSENELNVYEGRVEFGFDVTVPKYFTGEVVTVNVTVRYQACNDEVCFPPKNKRITLTAKVK